MGVLTQEIVVRRFEDLTTDKQDDVELLSNWIMHYKDKATIEMIVNGWLQVFRNAPTPVQRIGLFYVMNDVVQKAKHKNIDFLIPAFQSAVLSAVQMGRNDQQVAGAMRRCIDIFSERHVFTQATVSTMINFLMSDDNQEAEACVEMDTDEVYRKIEAFGKTREIIHRGMETLGKADFNYRKEIAYRMKDKREGAALLDEVSDAVQQMIDFRHAMENQKRKMLELIEVAELARRVFSSQLKEVTIVEDAYQKFGQGIREVQNELKEMKRTGIYPAATPPRDAPSPTANDDIYESGVEAALNSLRPLGSRDVHETADMEIGDEEDELLNLVTQHTNYSAKQYLERQKQQQTLQPHPHQHHPTHSAHHQSPVVTAASLTSAAAATAAAAQQSAMHTYVQPPHTPVTQHRGFPDPSSAPAQLAAAITRHQSVPSPPKAPIFQPPPIFPLSSGGPPNLTLPPPAFISNLGLPPPAFALPPPGLAQPPRLYSQQSEDNANGYRNPVLSQQSSYDEQQMASGSESFNMGEMSMDSAEDYALAYAAQEDGDYDYKSQQPSSQHVQNRRHSQPTRGGQGQGYYGNASAHAAGGGYSRDPRDRGHRGGFRGSRGGGRGGFNRDNQHGGFGNNRGGGGFHRGNNSYRGGGRNNFRSYD